jgi:hypothetical protein
VGRGGWLRGMVWTISGFVFLPNKGKWWWGGGGGCGNDEGPQATCRAGSQEQAGGKQALGGATRCSHHRRAGCPAGRPAEGAMGLSETPPLPQPGPPTAPFPGRGNHGTKCALAPRGAMNNMCALRSRPNRLQWRTERTQHGTSGFLQPCNGAAAGGQGVTTRPNGEGTRPGLPPPWAQT